MRLFLLSLLALLGVSTMAMAEGDQTTGSTAQGSVTGDGGVYTLTPYLSEDFSDVSFTITLSGENGSVVFTATNSEGSATYTATAGETTIEVSLEDLSTAIWNDESDEADAQTPAYSSFTFEEITDLTVEAATSTSTTIESVEFSYVWGEGNLNDYDNLYASLSNNSECTKLYFTYGETGLEETVEITSVESDIIAEIAKIATPNAASGEFDISTVVITLEVTTPAEYVTWQNVKLQGDRDPIGYDWYGSDLVAPLYENASISFSYNNGEWIIEVSEVTADDDTESTEATWETIATENNFVTDGTKWVGEDNNQLTLTFAALEGYEYIKIVGTTKTYADDTTDSETYENWTDWGAIELDQSWTVFGEMFSYDYTTADQEPIIASIAEIQAACANDATEFYIAFWSNTTAVTVYASADYEPEAEANVYACSMTFDISKLDLSSGNYFAIFVEDTNGDAYWTLGFSDVVVTVDGQTVDMTTCTGYSDAFDNGCLKLFESWNDLAETPISHDAQSMTVSFNLSARWGEVTAEEFATLNFTVQIDPVDGGEVKVAFSGTELLEGAIYAPSISTAISNVNVEVTEVARYNLMGQKISGAEKGINIIVYSDGSAKKVLVK